MSTPVDVPQIDIPHVVQHEKLSSLLAAAIDDARRVCKRPESDIKLDMSHWMHLSDSGDSAVCYVCLAGAMLVNDVPRNVIRLLHAVRLPDHPDNPCLYPADFATKTAKYLRAVNECRQGNVSQALFEFAVGYRVPVRVDVTVTRHVAREIKSRVCENMRLGGVDYWPSFDSEPDLWWDTMDELVKQLVEYGQ